MLDQRDGHDRLCASVRQWYTAAFPQSHATSSHNSRHSTHRGHTQDAVVACADGEVRIGIGPDPQTAGQLAS